MNLARDVSVISMAKKRRPVWPRTSEMNVRRSWRGKFVMELLVLVQSSKSVSGLKSEQRGYQVPVHGAEVAQFRRLARRT